MKRLLRDDNYLSILAFCPDEQMTIFKRFPSFLGIDGTYNINNHQYSLYQLVAVDGCGQGIPVFFGLLQNEKRETIQQFFRLFKEATNGDHQWIRAIMCDNSTPIQQAIEAEIPGAKIMLCQWHILRNGYKRKPASGTRTAFQTLVSTSNERRFAFALETIKTLDVSFYAYIEKELLPIVHRWSRLHQGALLCFGYHTNNFVERCKRTIKMGALRKDTVAKAAEKIAHGARYILWNRQGQLSIQQSGDYSIPDHRELDPICDKLTFAAIQRIQKNLKTTSTAIYRQESNEVIAEINPKQYRITHVEGTCSCIFYQENRLPCRHIVGAANAGLLQLGKLHIKVNILFKKMSSYTKGG